MTTTERERKNKLKMVWAAAAAFSTGIVVSVLSSALCKYIENISLFYAYIYYFISFLCFAFLLFARLKAHNIF